jgi:hypothetical protein
MEIGIGYNDRPGEDQIVTPRRLLNNCSNYLFSK